MTVRALTWNLFHGRDFPPGPSLFTWRSRLLRISERNATHVQTNRDLLPEFGSLLAGTDWDVALLQECPPRWVDALSERCAADSHAVLTARNSLPRLRGAITRLNPDLIASNEGGSNVILVRSAKGAIAERRALELRRRGMAERRTMAFARIESSGEGELCVANLHATAGAAHRALAEDDIRRAAEAAVRWAGAAPLIVGGDLNVRPRDSALYAELEQHFGLGGTTSPGSLDHLLARGLEPLEAAAAWPPERRELPAGELRLRLSDHAPVTATFAAPRAAAARRRK